MLDAQGGYHPLVFPCADIVECILKHVDPKEAMIKDSHGNLVSSFSSSNIVMYYKFPKEEMILDEEKISDFKIPPR